MIFPLVTVLQLKNPGWKQYRTRGDDPQIGVNHGKR